MLAEQAALFYHYARALRESEGDRRSVSAVIVYATDATYVDLRDRRSVSTRPARPTVCVGECLRDQATCAYCLFAYSAIQFYSHSYGPLPSPFSTSARAHVARAQRAKPGNIAKSRTTATIHTVPIQRVVPGSLMGVFRRTSGSLKTGRDSPALLQAQRRASSRYDRSNAGGAMIGRRHQQRA